MPLSYVLLPLIAALIGWFTNYIAVTMLFRPRRPYRFLGLTIQGIFPKRQKFLAERFGKLVAEQLLSSSDIKNKLLSGENIDTIMHMIEQKIENYLEDVFPEKYPITSIFFGSRRKMQIKQDLMEEVHVAVPDLLENYAGQIDKQINIEDMVRQKVEELDPLKLETLINSILKKEFAFIEWVGAVLGFFIGLLQVFIAHFSHI
ncbi:MAG: DUF445 family protein [Flavobacteriales bacterium]|nr:DUF445 family protein [Flavobacteriales bacterium]MCX7649739.1 DUF445 family protein [Flavobacteriales bacterium]MDW8431640.1 DUF445 family protein [Flavobacteriales bacterium]